MLEQEVGLMKACMPSRNVLGVSNFYRVYKDIKVNNMDQILREIKLGQKAVLLECASYGSLHDLSFYTKSLEEDTAFVLFYQIMCGLRDIHNKKIAHLDIKETNILICRSEESAKENLSAKLPIALKIADFGIGCDMRKH